MSKGVWGDEQTKFFFELTPDRVLRAVEASGLRCNGRCSTMNSFENRVYEVELEEDHEVREGCFDGGPEGQVADRRTSRLERRRVVKFYRPGRWTREQILEEHEFLEDLKEAEIPVIAPLRFADGRTLHSEADSGIYYAVFPKVGGRAPDEFTDGQLERVGRLLARIHNVGSFKTAAHRLRIDPSVYGIANLESLLAGDWLPLEFRERYESAVRRICAHVEPWFQQCRFIRIHGDCHLGNLLWNQEGPFFLDFDDMLLGPAVQDIWLLVPGRDSESIRQREVLLRGYEEMRFFDRSELKMIEALRALRFVHYTAWIARRWEDPAFPAAFPAFGSARYWAEVTADLEEQLRILADGSRY
jgi:Ser/Thr protein kinase RdoA (MazF antagonist)